MIVASYNVENMFQRPKAFAVDSKWQSKAIKRGTARADVSPLTTVIRLHAEINELFKKETYLDGDKTRIAEIIDSLRLRSTDKVDLVTLRIVPGKLLVRPKDKTKPVEVVASGRADWVGWLELNAAPVDELATDHLAMTIRDSDADILGVVEADNRIALDTFAHSFLEKVGARAYDQVMLFDGNDARGIDVGLLVRERQKFPVTYFRTHIFDEDDGGRVFSRDCAEYHLTENASGHTLIILINHFKSKGYSDRGDPAGAKRRRRQSIQVAKIYEELREQGHEQIVVLGDLNDSPTLASKAESSLQPLFDAGLKDISEHSYFEPGERIGTFGTDHSLRAKIDYILLSPQMFKRVARGGAIRKGVWHGPKVRMPWDMYDTMQGEQHAASDHALIWAEFDD